MPLPIAHGLIGAAVIAATARDARPRVIWKEMALGAVLAIAPDFDIFLTSVMHWEKTWHRGATHSLVWALGMGFLLALPMRGARLRMGLAFAAATFSHAILDWLVSVRGGVAVLWPFTTHRFALGLYEYPDVLNPVYHWRGDMLVIRGIKATLALSMWEVQLTSGVLLAVLLVRNHLARKGEFSATR
jgi:membrane-bound metal-dependent hydrolase YbcI (DUF457 family)